MLVALKYRLHGNMLLTGCQCGEGEIRTPEELSPLPLFESGAFDHSATSPRMVKLR